MVLGLQEAELLLDPLDGLDNVELEGRGRARLLSGNLEQKKRFYS